MSSPMTGRGPVARVAPAPPRIRRATAADARRLTAMVRRSRAYEGRYASMVAGVAVGPDYIEAHEVHLAEGADGVPLGFYALLVDPPELDLMFVADRAQGLGVGRLLIDHMRTEAGRAGLSRVRVVSHPPAEGFYRAMGAVRTGTALADPPVVAWDRPELHFDIAAG
ncbi:GNAT family N-acetyltransferase [Streptomyces sp. NPDC003860]